MADDWRNAGFGLYVHWPFCQAKCPYCDFNSHVAREIDHSAWVRAYLSELTRVASETQNRVLNTIYFGGGTPSLMNPDTTGAIIDTAKSLWRVANDLEITLEANPGSVEAGRFAGFHDAGVNRVSLGVQALNDPDLRRLGRIHTAQDAQTALGIARNCFDRVSFDLIYGRQDQTLAGWKAELKQALTLSSDHISLYQLTIEDGTAFADRFARGGLTGLPSEDLGADMYQATLDICADHDLAAYEVSNFANPGSESRHNLIYWRYGDYVGIGPGAHGRVTIDANRYATECISAPDKWLAAVNTDITELPRQMLSPQEQANEFLMMGLRLSKGLDPARYLALGGRELDRDKVKYLCDLGMLTFQNNNICATTQGRLVLNAVIRELLAG
ncbi:MAG: radical SAM family heme chaperone HemW [Rhodobacteraceae bacterium]|nr:radical SAM family heme chaperone HemW [Paracoccaceae bacterium]